MVEAVRQADGSYRLADGTVLTPPTMNQIRAEKLVETMFLDPELGAKAHGFAAKLFPDIKPHPNTIIRQTVVEPEIASIREQNKSLEEKLAKALERLDARDKHDEEQKTLEEMRTSVKSAVSKYALTPEGEQKMLDWMRENKVYNAEAAAAVVVHNAPPPAASGPSWAPRKNDFYGSASGKDEAFAELQKDPSGTFLDAEIGKFLKDPDQYAREAA